MFRKINKGIHYNFFLILFLCSPASAFAQTGSQANPGQAKRVIVIDPGHGGKDHGCNGHGSIEKLIVLKVAQRLKEKLEMRNSSFDIVLTRNKDEFIPLYKRAEIANKAKADLFLSIHCNAIHHQEVHGSETFVMGLHTEKENLAVAKRENSSILLEKNYEKNYGGFDPNSSEGHIFLTMYQTTYREQSIRLAELIEQQLSDIGGRRSRGVKEAGFVVLRATTMPSVLIENGFLTNPEESRFLNSNTGVELMSEGICQAVLNYEREVWAATRYPEDQPEVKPLSVSQGAHYCIQLFALTEEKAPKDLGLPTDLDLTVLKEGDLYKYIYGYFRDRSQAEKVLEELKSMGLKQAFIKSRS
ncbi:MAG TPA: N-acetylmuramoyl-L-alanine amidase [Saprospiraceae bacterium]|nr:N-acetylmuramoyl-L-alanine amidase [Saprospiraceae bacterium]